VVNRVKNQKSTFFRSLKMGKYCITAANHKNVSNHCASQFRVWEYDSVKSAWKPLGSKSINYVTDLLAAGHTVLSGKKNETTITLGAAIEVELRITKNEAQYKISTMPTF
jgi:hypothetical protein